MKCLIIFNSNKIPIQCYGKKSSDTPPGHFSIDNMKEIRSPDNYLVTYKKSNDCCKLDDIQQVYEWVEKQIEMIFRLSNGIIDFYESNGWTAKINQHIINKKFYQMKIRYDRILDDEALWIQNATKGPYKISPHPCTNTDLYCYDMRACYPNTLMEQYFYIPVKRGVFKTMTHSELINNHTSYGIYRCKVIDSSEKFIKNGQDYYTHTDLKLAKILGLKLRFIEDGSPNVLLYPTSTHCIRGCDLFSEYIEMLQHIKREHPECKIAKVLLSSIWGSLCEYQRVKNNDHIASKNHIPEISADEEIIGMKPTIEGNIQITTRVKNQMFLYNNYARLKPFMFSKSKFDIYHKVIAKYWDNISAIHIDGFYCLNKIEEFEHDLNIMGTIGRDKSHYRLMNHTVKPMKHKYCS